MTAQNGYLLIADISGYTQFLTSSELDHANPILQSLLQAVAEQVGEPLHFWKLEGDAVLAYSTRAELVSGDLLLTFCENLYNAFAARRQDIVANTTCPCRACANAGGLDLKVIVHYGAFEEMQVGPVRDLSGADVILVHRMTKTAAAAETGVRSYALFSDAAVQAMQLQAAMEPYSQPFEHFGEVSMQVYDLARAWDRFRAGQERDFLEEADGVWTCRRRFEAAPQLVWEAVTAPEFKLRWMDQVSTMEMDNPDGRLGTGSVYHCGHQLAEFVYRVTDWQPFKYFSTRIKDPGREGIELPETYELTPAAGGTGLRYTIGRARDRAGNRSEVSEQEAVGFLSEFWPVSFDAMDAELANPS
ncbi:DUF2652 domain-containing protein [Leisingera aquaemixtae]|uniref:DUF2652 domain-containing protein n=1 Tax=Leisingera aquaemixtae TaxID=1396826 RepID=A0ABY5WLU3_9RHOB|nr:DUF2652 domain-containing protein [Leisingera aquaemixtae]UWQ42431.1 DUF2652 domain-containing protein [Leisingera aquaemixtae]